MFVLIQVTLGVLFLLGNGYCHDSVDIGHIRNRTKIISYDMYEILQLLDEVVQPLDGGVVASPLMAVAPLGKLKSFSSGISKMQLDNYLQLTPEEIDYISPPNVQAELAKTLNTTFLVYSKTFVQTGLNLSRAFMQKNKVDHLNFRFPENAAKAINQWASAKSNGVIVDVADPHWIQKGTEVLMVNVLYLKGTWKHQFKEDETAGLFVGDHILNWRALWYMSQMDYFKYVQSHELNAHVVRMPFSDDDFEFILINPVDVYPNGFVLNVTKQLQANPEILEDALQAAQLALVEIAIPKVQISSVINTKEALKMLGVTDIFDGRLAKLDSLFVNNYKGHVTSMMQKVMIELDNKGVAASSGGDTGLKEKSTDTVSNINLIKVHATRPFLYQIRFKGYILFMGSYEGETRL